ncbi:hypothetical protein LCGC14_0408960 [marine sediment metagenome]|uniref:Uncharacterized protein n=1 Tax=marine sediment metagenome TaxID=412755 RepID=A0A0F9T086_9ZZZZ
MNNSIGSLKSFAEADKVYEVMLRKTKDGIQVVKVCIKNRQASIEEEPEIIYEVLNSSSIYYTIPARHAQKKVNGK